MNRIMELADDYACAVAATPNQPTPLERSLSVTQIERERNALQAEVARVEAELTALKSDIERYVKIASEAATKLAALENQEPYVYIQHNHLEKVLPDLPFMCRVSASKLAVGFVPLYLHAGAK